MIIEIGHLSLLLALTLSSFTILISTLGYINNWLNFEKLTFKEYYDNHKNYMNLIRNNEIFEIINAKKI